MKNYYLWLFVTVMLLGASSLQSAEIIPVWNKTLGEGSIQDMQLMPGGNEFMLTTSKGEIQIRSSENGELVRSHIDTTNLFMNGYFEFTPDSNRVVMCISGLLQLIDINTFERLKYFAFGKDSVIKGFDDLVIDPIRPYVYVTVNGYSRETGDPSDKRSKVQVYNYETMKLVKDLTPYGEGDYTAIAVSDDGKYLATLNDGKTYLKVWDLETMEQIINEPLYDPISTDRCEAEDIYFSKINPDLIYYSGNFTKKLNSQDMYPPSIYTFNKNSKKENLLLPNTIVGGFDLIFFNNETRILSTTNGVIYVINIPNGLVEYFGNPSVNKEKAIYNSNGDYFISSSNNFLSRYIYDSQSTIETGYEEEITISPNPTNSFVSLNLNCTEPQINYQINNTDGLLIYQNTTQNSSNNLQIDFSPYPVGVYFLTINCNQNQKTYKIIKEG